MRQVLSLLQLEDQILAIKSIILLHSQVYLEAL